MKYLMLHAVDGTTTPNGAACAAPDDALAGWVEEMTTRGILLDGARLRPVSDATSVRAPGGVPVVTDGPFAETKEQIAGYDVIECADLDAAVAVASAHPTTHVGSIEVRAFAEGMPDPEVPRAPEPGRFRYLMLVCADLRRAMSAEAEPDRRTDEPASDDHADADADADADAENHQDVDDWIDSLAAKRIYGWPLELPDQAVTVRRVEGRVMTTDGPFAETKEQIAGYDLLECADLDEALSAAAAHPVAGGGVIEVRPLWA